MNLTGRAIYQKSAAKPVKAPKVDRSGKIMRSAKGKPCTASWCNCGGSTETTVHCHVRKFGIGGTGYKPPDFIGFRGCALAHRMFDEGSDWDWESVCRAMIQTQIELSKAGLLYAA